MIPKNDQAWINFDTKSGHSILKSAQPIPCVTFQIVLATGNKGNLPMTMLDKMVQSLLNTGSIIGNNGWPHFP